LDKKVKVASTIFCNCARTGCLKEYCRCYKVGKICSELCNCR